MRIVDTLIALSIQITGFKLGTSTTSGYVLTADAAGNGTWQAATGGSGAAATFASTTKWDND